jgi:predicted AlkP superfamily phosphohydrolase/phosphomutase/tetratricopeptide (TPR) repeat protein
MSIERRVSESSPKRVLLVGWDSADWQMIHPLVAQGLMPTTAKFIQEGAWGNLATTRPILSPMLWNTIATGKRPIHHGVYGFTEPNTEGTGVRPVSSTSRKCKALWNILSQNELRSNVVGWYASHPAEPINGVMVSNQFEQYKESEGQISPLAEDVVHPAELATQLAELRVLPSEIDASAILPFIPRAGELVQKEKSRLGQLQHMLAQTSTIHAVATHLMVKTEWNFTSVYYEGIDRFGHAFMEFHPPKMEQVSQEDFEYYQHCMTGIYRFHDMLLETLLTLAGDDTAVILMSDHGYYNDHLRPDPREGKAGPVDWHRPFGILAAHGPGISQGTRLYGASILDVTPTVLHLLGLPAAYDMPGRILAEILDGTGPLRRIESWEEIDGDSGMHPADKRYDAAESQAMLEQLAALGYVDAPDDDVQKAIRDTLAGNQYNLIQSLVDARNYSRALLEFENLDENVRNSRTARALLASCYMNLDEKPKARELLEVLAGEGPDGLEPRIQMMLGALEFSEGNSERALEHLMAVEEAEPRLPGLHTRLGDVYLDMKRFDLAIVAFEKALSIDADSPTAYAGLAQAKLRRGENEAALEDGLIAAELVHHYPRVHLTIGEALSNLGDFDGAIEALELCIKQAPSLTAAHKLLAVTYRSVGQNEKAMLAELRAKGTLV